MWQIVLQNLIPTMFVIATPVALLIVNGVLKKLKDKWHLDASQAYDDKIDELVLKGIKAAEQKSLASVAKGGDMTPGQQKLDQAMKFVNAQLAAQNLPQKATDELSMLVEAHLFDGAKAQTTATNVIPKPDQAAADANVVIATTPAVPPEASPAALPAIAATTSPTPAASPVETVVVTPSVIVTPTT